MLIAIDGPAGADLLLRLTAALRALLQAGREPHLHIGAGRDDRADVAPLGDPVAAREQRALLVEEGGADGRVGSAARREVGDLRRPDRVADVLPVEQDAVAVERDPQARRVAVARQRDGAVHRPGIEVRVAERVGGRAGDGGLPGPRGAVDGEQHARATIEG